MFDRKFEKFLLKQVRRERAEFYGIMIAIGGCSIACVVMAIAALIIYGKESIITVITLLVLSLSFAGGCLGNRSIAHSDGSAAKEMADCLDDPECEIPDDYTDETIGARREACRKLHSIRSLIVAYGILSLTLWAATLLMAALAGIGTPDFSPMLTAVTFILFAMALPLTILTISYIPDLPAALRYRKQVDRILNGQETMEGPIDASDKNTDTGDNNIEKTEE